MSVSENNTAVLTSEDLKNIEESVLSGRIAMESLDEKIQRQLRGTRWTCNNRCIYRCLRTNCPLERLIGAEELYPNDKWHFHSHRNTLCLKCVPVECAHCEYTFEASEIVNQVCIDCAWNDAGCRLKNIEADESSQLHETSNAHAE